MQYVGYIVLSLVILLLMVLIHEAGHYTTAKILGFTVDEFSVGFGPKIFSKRRKNGELFSLRMLPLGGFCAFYGENGDEDEEKTPAPSAMTNEKTDDKASEANDCDDLLSYVMRTQEQSDTKVGAVEKVKEEPPEPARLGKDGKPALAFNEQKPWKRIIVLLGGVLFNFLSAFIFSLIYIWAVGFAAPVVAEIKSDPSGQLYCPDLRVNDVVLAVNGKDINVMRSFSDIVADMEEGKAVLRVLRDGDEVDVEVVRREITDANADGEPYTYVGFGFVSQNTFIGNSAGNAFKYCVPYTFKLSWSIIGSFGDLFTGKVPITSVSGPIGSINTMAQLSIADWRNILVLLPLLASNLAIFNILPFPALDGSHIVFTIIEWIRKKPINRKVEGMIHFIGMAVLLLFVLIVDILSFVL